MSLSLDKEMVLLAPEHHVRSVLIALLDDPAVHARAVNHYRALQAADNPTTGLKRKAMNDLFVCVQCDQAFTYEDNTETSCRYHPGDLEVDDEGDVWADHNGDCHGEIDTVEMKEEMPDGFRWSCCLKLGGRKGCTKGKHEADSAKSNKGGYVPSGSEMRKNAGSHIPIHEDSDSEE